MKYLVNPNNRSNNLKDNTNLCVHVCVHDGCSHCDHCTHCPHCKDCPANCFTDCGNNCGVNGCYCKVGNGRNEINSTGSFI